MIIGNRPNKTLVVADRKNKNRVESCIPENNSSLSSKLDLSHHQSSDAAHEHSNYVLHQTKLYNKIVGSTENTHKSILKNKSINVPHKYSSTSPLTSPSISPSTSPSITPRSTSSQRIPLTRHRNSSTSSPSLTPRNITDNSYHELYCGENLSIDNYEYEYSGNLSNIHDYSENLLLSLTSLRVSSLADVNINKKIKIYSDYIKNLKLNIYNRHIHGIYDHDPISHEDFINNESKIKIMPCGHYFFAETIHKWFLKSPTCPLCKHDILTNISFDDTK